MISGTNTTEINVKNGLKINCIFVDTSINAATANSSSVQNSNL